MSTMPEPSGFERRITFLETVEVRVTSYPVGRRFSARADNVNPGANIGRGMGDTREEAELAAMAVAAASLGFTDLANEIRQRIPRKPAPDVSNRSSNDPEGL